MIISGCMGFACTAPSTGVTWIPIKVLADGRLVVSDPAPTKSSDEGVKCQE